MKKLLVSGAIFSAALTLSLSSCGGSNSSKVDESNTVDSAEIVENTPVEPFAGASRYTASFFTDEANKSEVPTDSTYAETATGLRYVVVEAGNGRQPAATDAVTVHYTGTLTNGNVFDSSVARGEPATFALTQVIPGWTEGLQLMKEGGTTIFYIPSELAYGERVDPRGPIPPNAPLIFWVQLLNVQ